MLKGQARYRWLEAGFAVLARQGIQGLTIDVLCQELGLTKGSFYHHFAGHAAYLTALLELWELGTMHTIEMIRAAGPPRAQLRELMERASLESSGPLEVAVRAWAAQDPLARAYEERVDAARIAYLTELVGDSIEDRDEAQAFGRLIYAVFVGAQHLFPPIAGEELLRLYRYLNLRALSGEEQH